MDWKRGLALHFWYGRDVSMNYDKMDNLQLALSLYTTACKQYFSFFFNLKICLFYSLILDQKPIIQTRTIY